MPNVFEPEWDAERDAEPFRWQRARLGKQAGARDLGASLFEVPPGAATGSGARARRVPARTG